MIHTEELKINKHRSIIAKKLDNEKEYTKWHPSFICITHKSGIPGKKGAKSMVQFKREHEILTLHETVLENKLPEQLSLNYENKKLHIGINHTLRVQGENTLWRVQIEYRNKGIWKLLPPFPKNALIKMIQQYMRGLKMHLEDGAMQNECT